MFRLVAILAFAAAPAFAINLEIDVAGQANGTIVIQLRDDIAPIHVGQIITLALAGAYDGVVFHRVIDGFMAQTGDVENGQTGADLSAAGSGGSGWSGSAARRDIFATPSQLGRDDWRGSGRWRDCR